MFRHKFIATRLLCGFSGSDKYINLNSVQEIHDLYNVVMNGPIIKINDIDTIKETTSDIVKFHITDRQLNKTFPMHIKKQDDGLRFTLTEYVKYTKIIPGQIIVISIENLDNSYNIFIEFKEYYKYILEKHPRENKYRILCDNPPRSITTTITDNTDVFLSSFGIDATNDNTLKWSGKYCYSYIADGFTEKYIGVPYSNIDNLVCDNIDNNGEII
ncbi:hypothetical protein HOK00_00795 [bacterium]|jgi:hypothetical protein|nr:hypothetical protein [bacterium]